MHGSRLPEAALCSKSICRPGCPFRSCFCTIDQCGRSHRRAMAKMGEGPPVAPSAWQVKGPCSQRNTACHSWAAWCLEDDARTQRASSRTCERSVATGGAHAGNGARARSDEAVHVPCGRSASALTLAGGDDVKWFAGARMAQVASRDAYRLPSNWGALSWPQKV